MRSTHWLPLLSVLLACTLSACGTDDAVVLYVALDEEHSKQLVARFERETGTRVKARFDTEASKTVGLVSAIIEESSRPRCDVFWNNEIAHTVRLGQKGLLAPYVSPAAEGLPSAYRHTEGLYTGFAARARVLIVNTDLLPDPAERPTSMWDLIDPRWRGRCAVARPLTGTTLTHFTALRGVLGDEEFERFLDGLFENDVQFLQSNGATMRAVRDGDVAFAFTDTDDFHVALTKGYPVACVFPDQRADEVGTMLIPNSVALTLGAPHAEAARSLIDFILSEQVEGLLAAGRSAQIPLRSTVPGPAAQEILGVDAFRSMEWDLEGTAASLEDSSRLFQNRFGG
ncbi:MAG: extracellular solute-binding protein [bacterium]|nr:extracellular solute-binding protein [bacterium]